MKYYKNPKDLRERCNLYKSFLILVTRTCTHRVRAHYLNETLTFGNRVERVMYAFM